MMRHLLPILSGVMLTACVATTPRIEPGRLGEVHKGKTTIDHVTSRFGTPSLVSRNPDGTQFATYFHAEPGADPKAVVPLVAGVPRDSVTFHFDTKGLLTEVKTTSRTGGAAGAHPVERAPAAGSVGASAASAPAAGAGQRETPSHRAWWLLDWVPPPTTQNR